MRTSGTGALRLLAIALVAACSEPGGDLPSAPDTTTVTPITPISPTAQVVGYRVLLDTPHADDGALFLRVRGGTTDSVTSTMARVSTAPAGGDASVILWGSIADGHLASIWVPTRSGQSPDVHAVTIEQAAARGSYAQRDPARYTVRLERITR